MTLIIIAGGIDLSVGIDHCLRHRRHRGAAAGRRGPAACSAGRRGRGHALRFINGMLITRLRLSRSSSPGHAARRAGGGKGIRARTEDRCSAHMAEGTPGCPPSGRRVAHRSVGCVAHHAPRLHRRRHPHVHPPRAARHRRRIQRTDCAALRRPRGPCEGHCVCAAAALFAGVAGVLQFSRLTVGDPTVATGVELDVIAAVVIGGGSLSGGEGSIAGTIVGALIMTVIRSGCAQTGSPQLGPGNGHRRYHRCRRRARPLASAPQSCGSERKGPPCSTSSNLSPRASPTPFTGILELDDHGGAIRPHTVADSRAAPCGCSCHAASGAR